MATKDSSGLDSARLSAIVPARNEEAVIAACVESLAQQPEIGEILVVNDQSTDRTAEIVRGLAPKWPQVRMLETTVLPLAGSEKTMPFGSAPNKPRAIGCSLRMQTPCTKKTLRRRRCKSRGNRTPRWSLFLPNK